jgi:peptidoglycan/LPS O-acetylase OafA/YrhL
MSTWHAECRRLSKRDIDGRPNGGIVEAREWSFGRARRVQLGMWTPDLWRRSARVGVVARDSMKSSGRILQLDILRIIAVFLVLGRHADGFPVDEYGRFVSYLTDTWARCGWIGVDLFFVLSGFLVSGILFREYIDRGEIDFKRFFIRRGFKIYPAFYTMILMTVIAGIGQNVNLDRHRVWSEVFFVQNYFPALWTHTWFVSRRGTLLLAFACFTRVSQRWSFSSVTWSVNARRLSPFGISHSHCAHQWTG